jgi:trans-aconitate 2-methyltransferase
MQQGMTVEEYVGRYGHDWTDPEKVKDYVDRSDAQEDRYAALKYMVAFIPFDRALRIRILDIGAGQGVIAAAVLDQFPAGEAVGLDVSEPMRDFAMERMAKYGKRFSYHLGDFADGELPGDLQGPFDVAVSSRAIHHLPAENKAALYKDIFAHLTPGGCFFNLDTVAPSQPELRGTYRDASRYLRGERPDRSGTGAGRGGALTGHYYEPAQTHLEALRAAGFNPVDVFWKQMNVALIGGYRP